MKRTLTLGLCMFTLFAMSACLWQKSLAPVIVKSYAAVNDTIGVLKQSPSIISNDVPTLLNIANVVKVALALVGKSLGADKVQPYIDAVDAAIVQLKALQADPTDIGGVKIAKIIESMEKVRDGLVTVAKLAGCDKDLAAPKATLKPTIENVAVDAVELKKLCDKQ